jgi:hypothetical protein
MREKGERGVRKRGEGEELVKERMTKTKGVVGEKSERGGTVD